MRYAFAYGVEWRLKGLFPIGQVCISRPARQRGVCWDCGILCQPELAARREADAAVASCGQTSVNRWGSISLAAGVGTERRRYDARERRIGGDRDETRHLSQQQPTDPRPSLRQRERL